MSGYVLGVSAYYHDSAAALVRNGQIIAAAQEERLLRKKHDPRFPKRAINYCLGEAFIEPAELSAVVFYDSPLLTFDRLAHNALMTAPTGREQFVEACRVFLGSKGRLRDDFAEVLGHVPRLLVTPHHHAHAASCFYPSPFEEAAILTVDGVGEWATCTIGRGQGARIELLEEIRYPHSLGLLFSAFTYYCGFKVNSGEYKLMGLAPYGQPLYVDKIRDHLIDVRPDGSFRLNTDYFGYLNTGLMINERFEALMGQPARKPETPLTRFYRDVAASVQVVIEEVMLKLVAHATELAGTTNLVMAGGVALNCVANGRILRESKLDGLFIQPAAGDAGGALGAALLVSHELYGAPRTVQADSDSLQGGYLGPAFAAHEVAGFLDRQNAPHDKIEDDTERTRRIAEALAAGSVVAVLSGRMEFGPRALGARSILADPRGVDMQETLNAKVKFRENFRPFAPVVLSEHTQNYFDLGDESPYMLLVAPVAEQRRLALANGNGTSNGNGDSNGNGHHEDDLIAILNRQRSDIPAVTHVDYSARVQTVSPEGHPALRQILEAFHAQTGCPVLVNTSFNLRGEPMVCSPQDAYRCFMRSEIDLLVLEDTLIWKDQQPELLGDDDWRSQYELD